MSRYDIDSQEISRIQFHTNLPQKEKNRLMSIIEKRMSQEEQNLEAVEKWKHLFNTDLSAMVTDSYTRDCVVHYMGLSTVEGSDAFLKVEQYIIKH